MVIIKHLIQKGALLFSVFLLSQSFFSQKIIRFSDNKEFDSIIIVDGNKKNVIHKNEIGNYHFSENCRVFYDNKLSEFGINKDTLTFFDQIKEIDEVIIDENLKKQKVNTKKIKKRDRKAGLVDLLHNNRLAFFVKFNDSENTYINALNFIVYDKKNFDKNLGKLKFQILENKDDFPNDDNLLMEFEKNLSDLNLNFNNYLRAKMKINFPRKLKYPKNGFFIVMEYIVPKINDITFEANNDKIYGFYPKENKWKYMDKTTGYYYTLDIIK